MQATGVAQDDVTLDQASSAKATGVSKPRRRSRWFWWAGLAVVAVLVGLARMSWSDYRATSNVFAATGLPDCTGTTTGQFEMDQGSGFLQPVILMNKGFVCTITVQVWNRGGSAVTLGETTVPSGGVVSGVGFEVTEIGGKAVPSGLPGPDAIVDLNETIGPGQYQ